MKKYKEWLKDRLERLRETDVRMRKLYAPNSVEHRHFSGRLAAIDEVLDFIDELDEPEVLSQEWIDSNSVNASHDGVTEEYIHVVDLKNLIIPKQDLPVIPQFVADWWGRDADSVTMYGGDSIDKKRKINIISNFNDSGLSDHLSKVEDWIYENESTFLDLVNGKPYEVEEEQKYYTLDSKNIPLLERRGDKIQRTTTELNIYVKGRYISRFEFTEQEIKDYDERYFAFAVPVEETELF